MVEEPVQVVKPLVDDVLVDGALILDDDGKAVLVDPEGVDAPPMCLSGGVLALKECHPEQSPQVLLDVHLEGFFERYRGSFEFSGTRTVDAKYTYVAHVFTHLRYFPVVSV